jgi:hypothetical protein
MFADTPLIVARMGRGPTVTGLSLAGVRCWWRSCSGTTAGRARLIHRHSAFFGADDGNRTRALTLGITRAPGVYGQVSRFLRLIGWWRACYRCGPCRLWDTALTGAEVVRPDASGAEVCGIPTTPAGWPGPTGRVEVCFRRCLDRCAGRSRHLLCGAVTGTGCGRTHRMRSSERCRQRLNFGSGTLLVQV